MNYQMEGKASGYLVARKMSHKKAKREARSTPSMKGRRMSKKNQKKKLKGLAKSSRISISYEYEMKSRLTWEFADVFQNIDYWDESLKGEDSVRKPIDIEPQITKNENVDEIPVNESSLDNISTVDDPQDQKAGMIGNEPVGRGAGRCTTTSNETVSADSTAPINKPSANIQNDASPKNSVEKADERHAASSDDFCCEETFEETREKSRGTPRYLKRKSTNNKIIRKPAACDNLNIPTPEVHIEQFHHEHEMLEHQELPNKGVNNNTIAVDTHANQKQNMKIPVTVRIEKPYQCPQCPQMFLKKSNLTRHQRFHSGEKLFKCTECPKVFPRKDTLMTHQRVHSGEKPFKCTECPEMFSHKSTLVTHQRVHSGEKPFKCTECPKMFSQKPHLTRHQHVHSGEKPFKCTECPKIFPWKDTLTKHQRIDMKIPATVRIEKPYQCPQCPQMFLKKSNLTRHQRFHSGEKPFKCTECPKIFSRNDTLTKHLRIHSGEKPFKCTECPKMFSYKSTLVTHQSVHSGEKPFKCTECPEMFSWKGHLTRHHQRVHSGEKLLQCTSNKPKETV